MPLRLSQSVRLLNSALENVKNREQKNDIDRIYAALYEVNNSIRMKVQELTRPELEDIIRALDARIPLAPEQLATLRICIIGDAENYVRQEKDYATWHNELKELSGVIATSDLETASLDQLARVQGHIMDALNLIPSIQKYLEARDRIARFEQSSADIDPVKAELLIKLIENRLKTIRN
ncbi:MAG: hypothetical protein PHW69_06335 [Elusimicrobiaceae bacterium]|nr:hypothetical protein [Elusimicrobiaceae bacterium]